LLIDEEKEASSYYVRALEEKGYAVLQCSGPAEALEEIKKGIPTWR